MFDFISKSLKKVFGTKYDRDNAVYSPVVELINEEFVKLEGLSNDALRNKTVEFRQRIAEHLAGINEDIRNLKDDAQKEEDPSEKEIIFRKLINSLRRRINTWKIFSKSCFRRPLP